MRPLSFAPLTTPPLSHLCLYSISISIIFTFHNLKWIFRTLNDFIWKSHKLQIYCSNWDLQLWFWLFRHPRSFDKFKFQNVKTQPDFWDLKWFQMKNSSTTKLLFSSRSTTLVLVDFPSEVLKNLVF